MQTILLVVHVMLAIALAAIVLLQRSEGGALGIGGGGGGLVSSRGAGNILTKATWTLAVLFMLNSVVLTMLAGGGNEATSVFTGNSAPVAPVEQQAPTGPSAPVSE